jgi:hypothetical protein
LSDVRCWVNNGRHLLAASISGFDRNGHPADLPIQPDQL